MALHIDNNRFLIGKIDDLDKKLSGELSVDRLELLYLINSWGRNNNWVYTNDQIYIKSSNLKECYNLSRLDTSKINDMSELFKYSNFNGDINSWNTSKVTKMDRIFSDTKEFNSPLDQWDISNVTSMAYMFSNAKKFNQDINSWNVSNVMDMNGLFSNSIFNQPLDNWNVSNVVKMYEMFEEAKEFNQDIGNWDISNVTSMAYMFFKAEKFEQNLNKWILNINNILIMTAMFIDTNAFKDKFNNGKPLPEYSKELKEWFNENREKMIALDLKDNKKSSLEDFYSNLNNINKDIR